jgi:hypothetical protein
MGHAGLQLFDRDSRVKLENFDVLRPDKGLESLEIDHA